MAHGSVETSQAAGGAIRRRLYCYSGGLLRRGRVRSILELAGYETAFGLPPEGAAVGVWGHGPRAARGEWVAARRGARLVRIEDAFIRSIRPGRLGDPPLGLVIDEEGMHYDPARPGRLVRLLAEDPLDDHALLSRAREAMARLVAADLSKYNIHDPQIAPPAPGYVLVIDQLAGDASVRMGGMRPARFADMLAAARDENPGARIVIKTHPETARGLRAGHFGPADLDARTVLLDDPLSPWRLLEGAVAVYTVSSQMGFEAILAGHRPRVFGRPFYAGWDLTSDAEPSPGRGRRLTRAQLFTATMLLYPVWYDPCRDRLCSFEQALDQIEAEARVWREDSRGHVALGMRLWKRAPLQRAFGRWRRLRFASAAPAALARARREGRGLLVWAGHEPPALAREAARDGIPLRRVEDGFLRSRGLGAALVPALSLVADDLGIYYDPRHESRLERLIAAPLPPGGRARAERLIDRLTRERLSKYNLGPRALPELPEGLRILVPGQVEDDASITRGARGVTTNLGLLRRVRADNPHAVLIYKPHPDVEAGLRPGAVPENEALRLADLIAHRADPAVLIEAVDEVWTMTSGLGFEALLRGRKVTCLGAPFYAGWGLTEDLGLIPTRRRARPDLATLVHAALIAYPRYRDPQSGLPCPPEVIVERLATGSLPRVGPVNRTLAKAQGLLAGQAWLWRGRRNP